MKAALALALALALVAAPAAAADSAADASSWLAWLIGGAIVLFVVGVAVRMVVAARFPRGYRQWSAARRDAFAARNEAWDRDDEARRR